MKSRKSQWGLSMIALCVLTLGWTGCSRDNDEPCLPPVEPKPGVLEVINLNDQGTLEVDIATEQLVEVKLTPREGLEVEDYAIKFGSSDASIFEVTETEGLVKAIKNGTANLHITATARKPAEDLIKLTVPVSVVGELTIPVEKIIITNEDLKDGLTLDIRKVSTYDLGKEIAVQPTEATDPTVTYSSADEAVATVDENGIITGLTVGETTITIQSQDNPEVREVLKVTILKSIPKMNWFDKSEWKGYTSHILVPMSKGTQADKVEYLFDNDPNTFIRLVSPGKNARDKDSNGNEIYLEVDANDEIFVIIDLGEKKAFNALEIYSRALKVITMKEFELAGSNDFDATKEYKDQPFELIEHIVCTNGSSNDKTVIAKGDQVSLKDTHEYRYIKITPKEYGKMSTQLAEFSLGLEE